ncbi:MAG: hypothetical protein AAGD05_06410 [Bacteroidota bacterium]
MERQENKMTSRLEHLLSTKAYEALSRAEKNYVHQTWSEQEYRAYRRLVLESKLVFAEAPNHQAPDPSLRLRQLVKQKQHRPTWWTWLEQIINYPIPTWQPALGVLAILIFFFSPMSNNSAEPGQERQPVYVYQTDTVYRNLVDTIYKIAPKAAEERRTPARARRVGTGQKMTSTGTSRSTIGLDSVAATETTIGMLEQTLPPELMAFHLDTTVLRSGQQATMYRDSGHSLNEIQGVMDFFVEIY